ncbi:FtsH protease activity modulator HflK [Candidatus Liberibacter americanus]|uniref:Protein HflK n=1 Tax=Candidatus Liberibacter americanus str. Sao Paulo TaxID=1261131 RepID=U6B4V0_9HYPH|nr:FtsH protease activity modulator HflK [Candidatus Liberibacter americanus]AHA28094.1 HflK protein [Candidatus Liberibacter americanus str. Sao Paulo]EMS36059.1 HflK protein [Candidatus Liberibacter americanus PW_SP]
MNRKFDFIYPISYYGVFFVLLIGALFLSQSFYLVQPYERAVELRFGKAKDEIFLPGLHFMFWPIDTVEIVKVSEQQIRIGGKSSNRFSSGDLILTGDQNIVSVHFSVLYSVNDPKSYLFSLENPEIILKQVSESAIREEVGKSLASDIFRSNRHKISLNVKSIIQKAMDYYRSGILINTVSIEDVSPPREVADAFDEVQRAEQDENRFVEEANKYKNQILGKARGEASHIRESSIAYKVRVTQAAEGEADRFLSIYDKYLNYPDLLRKRIYLETIEHILKEAKKVIIDKKQAVLPHLPINDMFSYTNKQPMDGNK